MFYNSFTILENWLHEQMEKVTFLFPHQSYTLKKYVAWNSKIDSRLKLQKENTFNQAIFSLICVLVSRV